MTTGHGIITATTMVTTMDITDTTDITTTTTTITGTTCTRPSSSSALAHHNTLAQLNAQVPAVHGVVYMLADATVAAH